jgi:hypothetical protein
VLYRFIAAFIFIALAHSAQARPWLREKGTTFTAVSVTGTNYLDTTSQTYVEYGLTSETTLIADIGTSRLYLGAVGGSATFSVRRALSASDAVHKWAYGVGVGASWTDVATKPHLRTALSWGKGINMREKTGWVTVEAATIWDIEEAQHVAKVDATVGLNFTPVTAAMFQFFTAFSDQYSIAKLAPSVIITPKNAKFSIHIGTETAIGDFENSAVKFGLWRKF